MCHGHFVNQVLCGIGNSMTRVWRVPLLKHDWGDDQGEGKADWNELFCDLIYVAFMIQLSAFLHHDLGGACA